MLSAAIMLYLLWPETQALCYFLQMIGIDPRPIIYLAFCCTALEAVKIFDA